MPPRPPYPCRVFNGLAVASTSGEIAGLAAATTAAVLWACSTVLYGRAGARITAIWLNFIKSALAIGLFVLTLLLLGKPLLSPIWEQPAAGVLLLALSGFIGIAIGDTAYFACIRNVGPRQTALLSLLAVPAASAGGLLFLGERLPPLGWLGIAVTLAGIAWVVSERRIPAADEAPRHLMAGILLGLAASLCQAAGALMNRSVIRGGEFDDLWTATWRLVVSTVALMAFLPFWPRRPVGSNGQGRLWTYLIPATIMGTYGGIWLQQVAFARADTGYVQTLLSTTPIWILPVAMIAGEHVTLRAAIGSFIGLAGVVLLIWSSR